MARHGNAPPDEVPVVLAREGQHGPVVHAANRAARQDGVQVGSRVVDMRAICPELQVEYADVAGDRAALDRLVFWVRRWCPWSVRDGDDGIILDTTGSDHLMGGEAQMLATMEAELAMLGLTARLAVAPTWGAAWALARFGPVRAICGAEEAFFKLGPLPVAALRLDGPTVLLLRRLGLKTIGAVMDVPRLSLTRRFVKAALPANPLMRLDQALGKMAEPVASPDAPVPVRAFARLAEPVFDPTPYLPELCEDLCAQLRKAGQGVRRMHLTVYRTEGDTNTLEVAMAAATQDAKHLQSLFRDRLERINPGYGFDLITLAADVVEPVAARQVSLDGEADDPLELGRLLDRLVVKFGAHRVERSVLRASHMPERAVGRVPVLAGDVAQIEVPPKERPLRLFDHPEEVRVLYAVPEGPPAQFVWRRQTCRVARYAGPERIAPEWWTDKPGTRLRDYFKVEDHRGQRLWLYRDGVLGDGRGGLPRWFVHGLFA